VCVHMLILVQLYMQHR